jgi:ethanolamine utilization protein EutA
MERKSHSIVDHALGALHDHDHGGDIFDHDHDHDFPESYAVDPVAFVSIGLDIGSSSTQVAFSRLRLRSPGRHKDPEAYDRKTFYLSPILPTPYDGSGAIDEGRLQKIIGSAFAEVGLTPDDVDTGVVILTGEAALQRNASRIAKLVAEDVGDLVCSACGHHMEAMLSAYGSGAIEASLEGGGRRILLMDIGGATTKLAVVDRGRVVETAAFSAGGRLVVIDGENRIRRLDPAGMLYGRRAGFSWHVGDTIDPSARTLLAEKMANTIIGAISDDILFEAVPPPALTPPISNIGPIDGVMLAGGVAEYVYGKETRDFNDLGLALGMALKRRIESGLFPYPLLPHGECIRATVLGACSYGMQVSGDTIFISSHSDLLPCRNVPVVRPQIELADTIRPMEVAGAIIRNLEAFDRTDVSQPIALALPWSGAPSYERIRALAEGIMKGLSTRIGRDTAFYVLVESDIALSLGKILKEELEIASEIMVIDGVEAGNFDFVDIGRIRLPSYTVPVTIKSLVFGGLQGGAPSPT